jgi:hypothetical protein
MEFETSLMQLFIMWPRKYSASPSAMFLELPKAQILPDKPQTPGTFKGFKKPTINSNPEFIELSKPGGLKTLHPFPRSSQFHNELI